MAAELVDRFGQLPEEAQNLLDVVTLKRLCRTAGVEKLEAGPKGMVVQFRRNKFSNPAGLVAWMATKRPKDPAKDFGEMRLRPDHKLALVREMTITQRIRIAREVAQNLNRLAEQPAAA